MRIILIRHGKTAGNTEGRYIGTTDEPLCAEGRAELVKRKYPDAELVVSSPMKRCLETARLVYPDKTAVIYPELRECDFGDFENKSYRELSSNPAYQAWIDSGGTAGFPNGESREEFSGRCCREFVRAVYEARGCESVAFVVHGGTIMAVMESFGGAEYYDYRLENGAFIETECRLSDSGIILKTL